MRETPEQRNKRKKALRAKLVSFANSGQSVPLIESLQSLAGFSIPEAAKIESAVRLNIKEYDVDDFEAEKTRYPIMKGRCVAVLAEIERMPNFRTRLYIHLDGLRDPKTLVDGKFPDPNGELIEMIKATNDFLAERCEKFPARRRWLDRFRPRRLAQAILQALEALGHEDKFAPTIDAVFEELGLKHADPSRLIQQARKALKDGKKYLSEIKRDMKSRKPVSAGAWKRRRVLGRDPSRVRTI